jgi:hypothetical protein
MSYLQGAILTPGAGSVLHNVVERTRVLRSGLPGRSVRRRLGTKKANGVMTSVTPTSVE